MAIKNRRWMLGSEAFQDIPQYHGQLFFNVRDYNHQMHRTEAFSKGLCWYQVPANGFSNLVSVSAQIKPQLSGDDLALLGSFP